MLASLGCFLSREKVKKKECAQWIQHPGAVSCKINLICVSPKAGCTEDQIVYFLWADASYSHHNTKDIERGFPLLRFCSRLISSGIQVNLFHVTFYEGGKENGTNLVLGNGFFSLCLGREATLLFFSRLHTFLLLLALEMLWRKLLVILGSIRRGRCCSLGFWCPISVLATACKPQEKMILCWAFPASSRGAVGCLVSVGKGGYMGKGGWRTRVFFKWKLLP